MRSLFSRFSRSRGILLGAGIVLVWLVWPVVPTRAQVCATGGNCKASCDPTETEAVAGRSFCTFPPRNTCCVPTAAVCLSPKTCQAEANCDSATIDRTKTCGTEVCCVRRTSTPSGGLGSSCGTGGICQGNQCAASQQPDPSGNCAAGLFCCRASASACSGGNCVGQQCASLGLPDASGSCAAGLFCCGSKSQAPNFQTITFSNLLNFETVDEFLGKILGWLQGVVATLALVFIVIGGFLYVTSAGDSGRVETAKKCILAAVVGLAIALAAPSFLREIAGILGWGGVGTLPGTQLTLLQILTNIMNFLLSVVGIFAIIMLVVGGIMYLTAAGDEDQIDRAKKIVLYSVIGIAVALAALVLVSQLAKFFA